MYQMHNIQKSDIINVIQDKNISMTQAAKIIGIPMTSFKRICKTYDIYDPRINLNAIANRKIQIKRKNINREKIIDIIVGKRNPHIPSNTLKTKLLKYELIDPVCSKCGNTGTWNGEQLVLQLDHIDGNSRNNLKENLRLLCPNCHSQTKTYCRSVYSPNRVKYDELEKIVKEHNPKTMNELLGLLGVTSAKLNYRTVNKKLIEQNIKTRFKQRCLKCDKPITGKGVTGYCNKCSRVVQHKVEHPSKHELQGLIQMQSVLSIAKQYGVSDNAVRKWLKSYDLPYTKKDIQNYIENTVTGDKLASKAGDG